MRAFLGLDMDEPRRKRGNTVAESVTPASKFGGLGARIAWGGEGNGRGGRGLFIGSNMAGFNGVNRRQSREGFLPWFVAEISARGRRKRDVIADITVGPTCQSLRGKKGAGGAAESSRAGCARLVLGWPR